VLGMKDYLGSSLLGLAKAWYEKIGQPGAREQCRDYLGQVLALETASPRQRQAAQEILDELGAAPDPGPDGTSKL
jgi:hypothetical protein